jgi:hypothetical protein
MEREACLRAGGSRGWMSGLKLATASPDLPSIGVPIYRLSHRCGVLFPKLSKLLNQENALSVPCSPRAPRGALHGWPHGKPGRGGTGGAQRDRRNAANRLDPSLLMSHYCLLHPTHHAHKGLMSCRWLAAVARVERTGARPSRAVAKTALTCDSCFQSSTVLGLRP